MKKAVQIIFCLLIPVLSENVLAQGTTGETLSVAVPQERQEQNQKVAAVHGGGLSANP